MIPTNPTHGADGHSGASASNKTNTNPTNGADASNRRKPNAKPTNGAHASNSVNGTPSENVNKAPLANAMANAMANDKPHGTPHESKSVNNHEGVSVNAQAAQSQGARSYGPPIRPVLTLEEMGKIAVAASEYTYLEDSDPVTAIARFYYYVSEFFEGMNFFRAERGSLLLRMVRPFLEDPTTQKEERAAGWALVRALIENMMIQLDNQTIWTVAAGAASRFSDYTVYL